MVCRQNMFIFGVLKDFISNFTYRGCQITPPPAVWHVQEILLKRSHLRRPAAVCLTLPFPLLTVTFIFVLIIHAVSSYGYICYLNYMKSGIVYPSVWHMTSTQYFNYQHFLDAGLTHCFCTHGHSFFGDRMLWPKSPLLTDSFETSLMMDKLYRFSRWPMAIPVFFLESSS